MSDDESCSDCYWESIENRWKELLLNWVNKCVIYRKVNELHSNNLLSIVNKYKDDVSGDDLELLSLTDDLELFIKSKFPILRLGTVLDHEKGLFILTSLLLYYFCTNSQHAKIDADLYENLSKNELKIILKFCENLAEMEVTISNIERAIKDAYDESVREEMTGRWIQETNEIESELDNSSSISLYDAARIIKFKSSLTVLPTVFTDTTLSKTSVERLTDESDYKVGYMGTKLDRDNVVTVATTNKIEGQYNELPKSGSNEHTTQVKGSDQQSNCVCTKRIVDSDDIRKASVISKKQNRRCLIIFGSVALLLIIIILSIIPIWWINHSSLHSMRRSLEEKSHRENLAWTWICQNNFCQRIFSSDFNGTSYSSISRCTLLCSSLPLWPYPIGYIQYNKTIINISTKKLEYKFKSVPSLIVQEYLSEGFNLFLKYLTRLEKSKLKKVRDDLNLKKLNINIDIESDPDPRLRLNTDETYSLKIETGDDQVFIKISSESFCGVRHGLETLSQLILLDQSTGNLITLSNINIKDGPTYKYRGLMIDTARNFIPITDLIRTIDAMASCKLNTFHWRISDVTSFPLYLEKVPDLYNYGPYDKSMVYTKEDVKFLVKRAGVRGIRVLIEVAAPGPVGRAWSWLPETTCSKNDTCDNILCLRLAMQESVFDILQTIYSEIINLTHVHDVFHLSGSLFSFSNCYNLIKDREGFLEKALVRLKMANKGFLPRLPIIWYTNHLKREYEAKTWNRLGVQLSKWDPNSFKDNLSKFRVIQSSKWDLSCEMIKQRCTKYRSWQQMYSWKSWRNFDAFTVEGGECILWTDIVDASKNFGGQLEICRNFN